MTTTIRTKSKLKAILASAPETHAGVRGITNQIRQLSRYMRDNDLAFAGTSEIDIRIINILPSEWRVKNYSCGSRHRASSYTRGYLTGASELNAAREAAKALGIKTERGMLYRSVSPGVRDEYSFTKYGWRRVRRWKKVRGEDVWVTGKRVRHGKWAWQTARVDGGRRRLLVTLYSSMRSRKKAVDFHCIEKKPKNAILAVIKSLSRRYNKKLPAPISPRILRRLCPPEWEVVVTPPSEGAEPLPAYREVATGEEYHFAPTIYHRQPVMWARIAFENRAAFREQADLESLIARGEADNIYISAADSLLAGNCLAGTKSFASKHALDISRHYRAGEMLALGNGDARFVRAAVIAAIRRNRREMNSGVCVISEHVVKSL